MATDPQSAERYTGTASQRCPSVAITGPAGSGKSTVAQMLAEHLPRSVAIDVDSVKHFIASGFQYDLSPDGLAQWELLGRNLGMLCQNFARAGYEVILYGYLNEDAWLAMDDYFRFSLRFLLLYDLDTNISRDASRPDDARMGSHAVRKHHEYFTHTQFFESFSRIDSTNQSVEETCVAILDAFRDQ